MSDKEILKQIGLSDSELRDYLAKVNKLFNELNKKQRRVFIASMSSAHEALRTLSPDITAEQLEHFIRSREDESATAIFFVRVAGPPYPPKDY